MNAPGRRDPQAMRYSIGVAVLPMHRPDPSTDAKFVPGEEAEGSFIAV